MATSSDDGVDNARTSISEVREELGDESQSLSDGLLKAWIGRAHRLVEQRVESYIDRALGNATRTEEAEATLTDLERLTACHFAYPTASGATRGGQIKQKAAEGESITWDTANTASGADGDDPYWQQALRLDPTGRLGQRVRRGNVVMRR